MFAQRSFGTRCAGDEGFACGEGEGGGVGRESRAGSRDGEAGGLDVRVLGPEAEVEEEEEALGRMVSSDSRPEASASR